MGKEILSMCEQHRSPVMSTGICDQTQVFHKGDLELRAQSRSVGGVSLYKQAGNGIWFPFYNAVLISGIPQEGRKQEMMQYLILLNKSLHGFMEVCLWYTQMKLWTMHYYIICFHSY